MVNNAENRVPTVFVRDDSRKVAASRSWLIMVMTNVGGFGQNNLNAFEKPLPHLYARTISLTSRIHMVL